MGRGKSADSSSPEAVVAPDVRTDICRAKGHQAWPDVSQYISGRLVFYCSVCGDRMEIPWVRGGTVAARVEFELPVYMKVEDPLPHHFDLLAELEEQLREDAAGIEAALEALGLVRQSMTERL